MGKGYIVIHNKQVQEIQLILVSICLKSQGFYISSIISYIYKYWENESEPIDAYFISIGQAEFFTNVYKILSICQFLPFKNTTCRKRKFWDK